jgi:N-acetylglucosaminyldiphosphoundecaprenol N-acetyl-beta-D-mannosaminyltransferase
MLAMVNEFKPEILFVGMTAPKQEKWVYLNKDNIDANTIVSIGAVFDFYSGNIKRSSDFWISIGLEWLPRFLKEPKRLAKRNLVSTPKFLLEIIWIKIFGRGIL